MSVPLSHATPPRRAERWGFGASLLVLVTTLGAASLAVIPGLTIGDTTLTARIAGQLGSMITQNVIFVAVPVVILALLYRARPVPAAFGLRTPSRPWLTIGAVVVAFVGYVVLSAGMGALLGVGDQEDSLPTKLGATESAAAGVTIALAVTILAPVGEEFLMRGVVFAGMRDGARALVRPWVAVVFAAMVNGMIFGALHGATDPIFIPMLILLGAILCLLYQATGSLYAPIALHLTNNTVAIAAALDWSVAEAATLWMFAAAALASLAWMLSSFVGRDVPVPA